MKNFKDIRKQDEDYVSHAQRKAVWASRNDEKKKSKKEAVEEKKLTPAEMKKREEIAKAMERDNPGMDMSKKMAIATATAKKVAEKVEQIDELSPNTLSRYVKKADKQADKASDSYSRAAARRSDFASDTPAMAKNAKKFAKRDTGAALARKKLANQNEAVDLDKASKSDMLCKECGDQFGKPTNEKCMYDAYDQLGENWVTKEMYEGLDITEISLDMLTKKISNSGMSTTKKANKMDKTKNDLAAMKARLAGKPSLAKEEVELDENITKMSNARLKYHATKGFPHGSYSNAEVKDEHKRRMRVEPNYHTVKPSLNEAYEDNEPASPDEASMALKQLEFIEYAAEEMMDHIKSGKEFPEWFQNKLSKAHGEIEGLHSSMGEHGEDEEVTESAAMGAVAKKMSDDRARNKSNSSSSSYGGKTTKSAEPSKASSSGSGGRKTMTKLEAHKAQLSRAADQHNKTAAHHDKKSESILGKITGSNAKHKAAADLHRQAATHLNSTVKNYNQSNLTKAKSASDAAHASTKKLSESLEEQSNRRKGAPKMKGDFVAIQRAKDAELNKALGRTKTGRKKPVRQMTSTQRSLAQLRREETELDEGISNNMRLISKIKNSGVVKSGSMSKDTKPAPKKEGVNTADRKPEKYIKPDGKIGIRMVPMDKNIVDKDK